MMPLWRRELTAVSIALLAAMAVGSVLILAFGQSPARVYTALLASSWGSFYGAGQTLFKATPLLLTGLAVSLPFRAGLFNIGGEGQLIAGAFAAAIAGASLPASTPALVAAPAAILAALAAGAAVGALPGLLRALTGAHEVINTIMLNFVVAAGVLWIGNGGAFVASTTHTADVVAGARLPDLGIAGSAANWTLALALAFAAVVWLLLKSSRFGYEIGLLGENPAAAENAGVRVGQATVAVMAAGGALAGLAGVNYVLGYKHYFEEGMGRGIGFLGIAVALLGRNHPLGIAAAALLFGTLNQGGLAVHALVPTELIDVLQAVIILVVAAASASVRAPRGAG